MSKSTIGPHAPSKAQSQYSIEPSSGGIFFETKGAIVSLILGLTACGGGDGSTPGSTPPVTPPLTPAVAPPVTLPGTTPIESVPVSSSSYIELGPIAGGTVSFQTLSGKVLSTGGTKDDGSLDYNPRDIVSKMGSDQWLLVNVSGGRDTDVDDDGVTDAVPTPLLGSFRMLVPRSTLELGGKIVVNPRSGMISELLLAKKTAITLESLDIGAKQSGAEDQNNDGVVNYKDTYSVRMRDVKGVSKIVPATSGYITSIHSGNAANKTAALSKVAKTENHIMTHIIPANDTNDHAPSLELTTSTPGATILYTLDSSNPVPGGATTRSALSRVVVPFQNAKIYYREYTTINGQEVLGKVAGFDLLSDWKELAGRSVPYNTSGRANTTTESLTYKNIPYFITTTSNGVSSGYTYPKTINCQVGSNKDAGCHYGPYMVFSPEHESRVRSLITTAVQTHIDTPGVIVPIDPVKPNPIDPVKPNPGIKNKNTYEIVQDWTNYQTSRYMIQIIWNTTGSLTSNFPTTVQGIYKSPKTGGNIEINTTVNNETERINKMSEIQKLMKETIDKEIVPSPTCTKNQIKYEAFMNYRGYGFQAVSVCNTNGTSDFPMIVYTEYTLPGATELLTTPAQSTVYNESQKTEQIAYHNSIAKAHIDAALDDQYQPGQEVKTTPELYRGGSFFFTKSYTRTLGKDFPADLYATIVFPNSTNTGLVLIGSALKDEGQMNASMASYATFAKSEIDKNVIPINLVDVIRNNTIYNGATYSIKNTWTLGSNNTKIFPVRIDWSITRKNGQAYIPNAIIANNQGELTNYNTQAETEAKRYIDADNIPPPTHSLNHSVSYTTRVNNYYGGFYEVFNTYNLSGTSDFPVQISGIYGVMNQGTKTPAIVMAANEAERIQKSNQMVADIQRIIQAGYNTIPVPTYPQNYLVPTSFVSYRGYGYQLLTTMNISGTSDYPASVRVSYTTPISNSNTTQTINANSAAELSSVQTERINDAKANIDLIVNADQYPPNYLEVMRNSTSYGGGSYRTTFTYSGNAGQDYPGYVDVYVTYRNGSADKLTIQVDNANQKNTYASNLEDQAKSQIDNYNPSYAPNQVMSDGPYRYGNKGGDYTIKVMYNRIGTGANYPALVWIEFHERSGGILLDTRNIRAIGDKFANNSIEKEQIKQDLERNIQTRLTADASGVMNRINKTLFATNWKLHNLLPLSSAHAQVNSGESIRVKKNTENLITLPNFTPYDSTTNYGKWMVGGNVWDHFVKNGQDGVAGVSLAELEKKTNEKIVESAGIYLENQFILVGNLRSKIFCDGLCKYPPNWEKEVTILSTKLVEYSLLTDPEFKKKYDDLVKAQSQGNPNLAADIARGVKEGMIKAVKEYIEGYRSLLDLNLFEVIIAVKDIGKAAIDIVSNGVDIDKIESASSKALSEGYDTLKKLPGAIGGLGAYDKSLFSTYIASYIGIEVMDPLKKTIELLKGVEFPGMAMSQFLVGKMDAGSPVRDLGKAEEAFKILQKAVDGVKNLANTRLSYPLNVEFGKRMDKMDEYTKNLYIADPEKWIANYDNGIKSGKKYNVLIEPDTDGTKLFPVFNGTKFKDSRGFTLRDTNDFVVMNGKIYFGKKHSFISRGENVEFAGRAKFTKEGELLALDNWSGHYQSRIEDKYIAIKAIQDLGFDASNIPFNSSSF